MSQKYYLLYTLFFISFYCQAQRIYYVKENGILDGNALSWEQASPNLARVLKLAVEGDEIWVAAGTYKPTCDTNASVSFSIPSGVKMYGGFPNFGNPTQKNRNRLQYKTILSGDIGNDDKNIEGNKIVAKIADIVGKNSYHLIHFKQVNSATLLSGFVLMGGKANGENFPENVGGAILNEGAYFSKTSTPTIEECVFICNSAASYGGAVYNYGAYGNANITFRNCYFFENTAYQGGAVANDAFRGICTALFQACDFIDNVAEDGGAVYNYGEVGNCSPIFEDCYFLRNQAQKGVGGAVYNYAYKGESLPTFANCIFEENQAKEGNEVFDYQSEVLPSLEKEVFEEMISIFPNPSTDYMTILNSYSEKIEIEIQNLSGEKILQETVLNGEKRLLSLKDLPKGTYIILATNEAKALCYLQKVVKQ